MKIKFQQFLFGTGSHSWGLVGKALARSFIKSGHEVHLFSTDGIKDEFVPDDLRPYIIKDINDKYDMQMSYTAMINFPAYLSHGDKNRFGIWCYETSKLPDGFTKYYKFCDKLMPPSQFAKDIFVDNGIPENHIMVLPHGTNFEEFSTKEIYPLKTKRKRKILANIAQPHIRKNLPGLFEVYGKAFTKDDDVCLVMKINVKHNVPSKIKIEKPKTARFAKKEAKAAAEEPAEKFNQFDVDFYQVYNEFKRKYPNHAPVELITDYLPSMAPLYNAIDISFSMTYSEAWHLPSSEALAAGKMVVVPRYGGQLDFCNDDNSLLIDGKIIRAPKSMQYWQANVHATMFDPSHDHAIELLKHAVNNYDSLMEKFRPNLRTHLLSWDQVAGRVLSICQ